MSADDDDAAVLARLAALDAEVRAEVAEKQKAKDAQLAMIRAERARREALKAAAAPAATPAEAPAKPAAAAEGKPAAKPAAAARPAAAAAARPAPKPEPKLIPRSAAAPEPATAKPAARKGRGRDPEPAPPPDDDDDGLLGGALALRDGAKLAKKAAAAKAELERPREKGEKSWLASTGLSLLFGPLGWLYAGSFREAIPAGFAYLVAAAILSKLPMFLVMPVLMVAMPVSAIAGLVYAIQYNRHGQRMRLFGEDKAKDGGKGKLAGKGKPKLLPGDD